MKRLCVYITSVIIFQIGFSQTLYVPNGVSGIDSSSNGNVGIGTSTPVGKLDVIGPGVFKDGSVLDIRLSTPVGKNGVVFSYLEYGNSSRFDIYNSDNTVIGNRFFELKFNGDSRGLVIRKGGNVGIGTSGPSSKLDIEQNQNGSTMIEVSNNHTGNLARRGFYAGNGSSGHAIAMMSTSENYDAVTGWESSGIISTDSQLINGLALRTSSGKIRFQPGGTTDKIVFDEAGNVGIGLANPSEKLVVDGKILSEEIKVEVVSGADYVFEEGYDLQSLTEIEDYIKTNKHLPEVPSADEMVSQGIDIGAMNVLLLKKIEELTLHLIEQEDEMEVLKARILALEAK